MNRASGLAMMSDERSKKRIQELEDLNDTYAALLDDEPAPKPSVRAPDLAGLDAAQKLKNAGSYEYSYKNPAHGQGRYSGPMAQELEGIPGVVEDTPQGKAVNTGRLTLANASAIGQQQRDLDELKADYEALLDEDEIEYPKPRRPNL